MYIVSGACEGFTWETTAHENQADAVKAMVQLLKDGWSFDDKDMWDDSDRTLMAADFDSATQAANRTFDQHYSNGDLVHKVFTFGDRESAMGTSGPEWCVAIVRY